MVYASTFTHVDVCDTPLHRKALDAVLRHIDRNPNRLAFVSATDSSVKITFKELYAQAHHVASFFSNKGFGHLDVCCMVMPNCIQYASIYLGALLTGGVLSGASAMFTEYELRRQFVDSECKIVVTDDSYLEKVLLTAKSCPLIKCVICVPSSKSSNSITSGAVTWDEVVSTPITAIPTYNYSPDDTALLPYSSGTTGPPKGVMLTHRNFSTVQEVVSRHFDEHIVSKLANHRWDYYEENLLLLLPFYHIYGFGLMNMVLLTGMTGVVFEKFDPILLLNNIQTHKPKMLMTVPPILLFLAKSPSTKNFDLTSIEFVLTGAAPAGKDLCDEFLCKFKHVRFLAQEVGVGERGEICVSGPTVMRGYLNRPQATDETIDADGWLHTGDIGFIDENGQTFIVDRLKELIKVKGLQVAPAELEDILLSHKEIKDAAVIGVPDEKTGEKPRAYVVAANSQLTEGQVQRFIEEKVSSYKHLTGGVAFVTEIPKSPSGKILRRVLREQYKLCANSKL
ncbi:hypothetical protein Q1695_010991 [Nippostrongylus brasiliensis]|nr:hypothetical protein Q1695_010991 [Nippostrongylus brasiliensis]